MSVLIAGMAAGVPCASSPVVPGPRAHVELWMEVHINGMPMAEPARLVRLTSGELLARVEDFARWRIHAPAVPPYAVRGNAYLPLDAVQGLAYEIDEATQTVLIAGRAETFVPTVISARDVSFAPPDRSAGGGFLNYDLQLQRSDGTRRLDGLFELGAFNRWGFGTTTFLARGLDSGHGAVRLDTAWTRDEPATRRSLRVGDSISRGGGWVSSVQFGGVQWGSDFATRPDFVSFPQPTASGETLLPSTVDVYVDNALRLSRPVPYGPFTIPDVPVITGEGLVKLVVRDPLGREQVTTMPYYVAPGALKAGLHDYTYEAGFERRRFATASNDYGRFFVAGTHRLGVSDRVTAELRGELLASQQTVGAGATVVWPGVGVVSSALAASHSRDGSGALLSLGIERQARPLSFGIHSDFISAGFTQLGASRVRVPPRQRSIARAAYSMGRPGSVFVSHVRRMNRLEPAAEFVTAGYTTTLPGRVYLSLFAVKTLRGDASHSVGLTLTRSLGSRTSASATVNARDGERTPGIQLQRSLPSGPGLGYRVGGSGGARPRKEASVFVQGDIGTYGAEVARIGDSSGQRFSARGALAVLGGAMHLSRRLDDSFAVVQVGDFSGVEVFLENQPVARTRSGGSALVPSLRAYQPNRIRIGPDDLPLDAEIGTLSMTATPARRSGALVRFPVHVSRGALLRIVLDDGTPLPSGALVRVRGQTEAFPVALRGEAYVTGLERDNELQALWKGRICTLRATLPRDAGPLPVVGPLVCSGVLP